MAESKAPAKATMAPAARNPEGEGANPTPDVTMDEASRSVQGLTVPELQALRRRVDAQLARLSAQPAEPSFGISEGTRQELANREALRDSDPEAAAAQVVTSPFTGAPVDGDGSPRERSGK
ncbi:MAG TPA: hypothetical protein VF092_15985 [Longimicrobium sp.]